MQRIFKVISSLLLGCAVIAEAQALHDYPADEYWLRTDESSLLTIDHTEWQLTLDTYLKTNTSTGIHLVDYAALQESGLSRLDNYLKEMSSIKIRGYNRAEQFAYWVNLYNAVTIKLITDNYPLSSITKLGGLFAFGPWDDEIITVEQKKLSLNDIEHRILRPIWKDFRIHFVVNCASLGCPNLPALALTSTNTSAILESSTKNFLNHSRGLEITNSELRLSKIFKWYRSDFGDSEEEMIDTLAQYLDTDLKASLKSRKRRVGYQYDWALNGLP